MTGMTEDETTPLTTVLRLLRSRAEQHASIDRALVNELRSALDRYEGAFTLAAETAVAQRAMSAFGDEAPSTVDVSPAKEHLVRCLERALDALRPTEEEQPAPRPPERQTNVEEPVAQPVSERELQAFFEKIREEVPPSLPRGRDVAAERNALGRLLHDVGEPPSLFDDDDVRAELDKLDAVTSEEKMKRWDALRVDVLTSWLSMLVARGRAVREHIDPSSPLRGRLRDVLVRLPTYAARRRTGFINGMTPKHEPARGSWTADATHRLAELRELVTPPPRSSEPAMPAMSAKRSRESRDGDEREDDGPIDWALREVAPRMRVLLFGGTPREDARANLERLLGLGEIEWPDSDRPRRMEALAERVAAKRFDVVLMNRLVRHSEVEKLVAASKASGTPFTMVESGGYGLEAVRHAIESALDRH